MYLRNTKKYVNQVHTVHQGKIPFEQIFFSSCKLCIAKYFVYM